MLKRLITISILLPITLACILNGGLFLYGFLSIVVILSSYELSRLLFSQTIHHILIPIINTFIFFTSILYTAIWTQPITYTIILISWSFFFIELKSPTMNSSTLLGYWKSIILISFSFPYVHLIIKKPQGLFLLLVLCITVWICDTCCLFVGKHFGKSHLSIASPNKTLEGSAGGILGSTLITSLFLWTQNKFNIHYIAIPFIMSFVVQIGDLYESLLKRRANVKDSSNLLPGHGGILDRSDSFLIGLPAYYILLSFLGFN